MFKFSGRLSSLTRLLSALNRRCHAKPRSGMNVQARNMSMRKGDVARRWRWRGPWVAEEATGVLKDGDSAGRKVATASAVLIASALGVRAYSTYNPGEAIPEKERSLLNQSFAWFGGGIVLSVLASRSLLKFRHLSGMMKAHPWLCASFGLLVSVESFVRTLDEKDDLKKRLRWLTFNACQAVALTPLLFLNPAFMYRGALLILAVLGSTAYVNATARNTTDLKSGHWVIIAAIITASHVAPVLLPAGLRALSVIEALPVYLYAGAFSELLSQCAAAIQQHAEDEDRDPINEAAWILWGIIQLHIQLAQLGADWFMKKIQSG
ncbi:bax inhibitor family protein [Moniliophthora roreri MCA 2997]|uniref:Bax inhibitor family protein n=1 Tax=Moniliophthora roreri (strain MCA 2997) TaxID=1381753 RepID=V2X5C3_MONRO|nr:bax inhibitor family protein [Moniliophthora roreri MCA 2997]